MQLTGIRFPRARRFSAPRRLCFPTFRLCFVWNGQSGSDFRISGSAGLRLKPLEPRRAWAILFGAIIIAAFAADTPAQLLYQDTFSYADGPILTAPGSPWVNNYEPTNQINVVAGKLVLTQAAEESVRYNFPTSYSQTNLYAGFQVQFSALPAGQGNYFAFFRATGVDALAGRLWATTNGAAPGKFRLGVNVLSSAAANTDLATANWISIGSAAANALGIIQFTDPNAAGRPARFYRLLAQ